MLSLVDFAGGTKQIPLASSRLRAVESILICHPLSVCLANCMCAACFGPVSFSVILGQGIEGCHASLHDVIKEKMLELRR
eukprot:2991037-Amphidinium_carterae.1